MSRKRANGKTEYFHSMVSAAMVAPGHDRVLPLEPEFITPQDGADKQDCESRATARWLSARAAQYSDLKPIYLGDDLSSRQPTCESVQAIGAHFLFTAKPSSHKTLYEWLDGADVPVIEKKIKQGKRFVTHRHRWLARSCPAAGWKGRAARQLAGNRDYRCERQGHLSQQLRDQSGRERK